MSSTKDDNISQRLRPRVQQPALHKINAAEEAPATEEIASRPRHGNRRHAEPENQQTDLQSVEQKYQPTPRKQHKITAFQTEYEERFVHPHDEKLQNPNKETAHEWFTQAECDLEVGKGILRDIKLNPHRGYYAVCFHCHEAVEKGVKAAKYATNEQVELTHSFKDNIPKNDDSLSSDCVELRKLIKTIEMMRYPCNNLIPADRYTPNQAEEALRLTEKILQHVFKTYL